MTKTLSLLPGISPDHPQATWEIGPVGHHRDSDLGEESNWDVVTEAYAAVDPDGEDHEIHRFGHFAVGWVEEVAYRPGSKVSELAEGFRARLEGYPILDENRHSQFEQEAVENNWPAIARDLKKQVLKVCQTWEGWDDSYEDKLDDVSDEEWVDLASGFGESQEGWIKYGRDDVTNISTRVAEKLGFIFLDERLDA